MDLVTAVELAKKRSRCRAGYSHVVCDDEDCESDDSFCVMTYQEFVLSGDDDARILVSYDGGEDRYEFEFFCRGDKEALLAAGVVIE